MKTITKYKLCRVSEQQVNEQAFIQLNTDTSAGFRRDALGEFDHKEDAISAAFQFCKYSDWTIIEVISFDNF